MIRFIRLTSSAYIEASQRRESIRRCDALVGQVLHERQDTRENRSKVYDHNDAIF